MKRRRAYAEVAVAVDQGGWTVLLDGKRLTSPAKASLALPTRALAEAVAAEWRAQGAVIDPATMPMMRLVSIMTDLVAPRRESVRAELGKYAGTDLVCYRADRPAELVRRQEASWQPLVDWAVLSFDAPLSVTSGVIPMPQPLAAMRALETAVARYDTPRLTALYCAATALGSLVLGLALVEGRLDPEAAFAAAQLDETFQIEEWGEDPEQTARRAALKDDVAAVGCFLGLL